MSLSVRGRFCGVCRGLALVVAPLIVGCGSLPTEEPGPQFPQGGQPAQQAVQPEEAIGTPGTPQRERTAALDDVNGVPYGEQYPGDPGSIAVATASDSPGQASDEYSDTDPSALTDFHSALDPYGQWVDDGTYGTIWQPSSGVVGNDFAPYETGGHWSYGDDYVWVSDYSWGWAPFHYGRWVYATNGWGSIPGRRYAGAWTTWRTGYGASSGYVGWAPLPPTYYWRNGVALGIGAVPPAAYVFCNSGNLFAPSLGGRMVVGPQVGAIGQSTRPFQGAVGVNAGRGAFGGASYAGGRTLAHPEIAGPSPQSMHIAGAVPRPPTNNAGLVRAAQFAHPSTATALGAHGPAGWTGSRAATYRAATAGGASRPFAGSMGTSAYGRGYDPGFRGETRTLGQGAVGGHVYSGRAYYAPSTTLHGGSVYGAGHAFSHGGNHGAPVPQYHPPAYGGGYHPPEGGGGGGGGGHFGGRGGGGHGGHR